MWRVTLKGLLAHKLRFALTALAVFLGVSFMAGTLVLTDTVGKAFDDLFADVNAGTDAVVRRVQPIDEAHDAPVPRPPVGDDLLARVRRVDGVAHAEGSVFGFAVILDADGEPVLDPGRGPATFGTDWPESDELNPMMLVADADGQTSRPPRGSDEVVIDKASADKGDFRIGDTVLVATQAGTREMTLVGVATFGEVDSPGGASMALFDGETAQELLRAPGEHDEIRVVGVDGVSQEELKRRLLAAVGTDDVEVLTGAEITQEDQDRITEGLSFFSTFLLVFAGIALFVGSFIIFNTFSIVVAQRTREMALLRALGAGRAQVLGSVMGEALVVGVLASALGIGYGIVLASGLQSLLEAIGVDIPAGGTVVTARTVAWSLSAGVAITLVAAIVPARKAARVPPIAALAEVAVDTSGRSPRRVAVGLGVLALGVAFLVWGLVGDPDVTVDLLVVTAHVSPLAAVGVGVLVVFLGVATLGPVLVRPLAGIIGAPLPALRGVRGTLAVENARRNPKRTSATAAALMIAVGLVGLIVILADSTKASIDKVLGDVFRADFVIDSGTFGLGGLSTDLADAVARLDGVEAVSGIRSTTVEIDGDATDVIGVDPESITRLFDVGVSEGTIEGMGATDMAVLRDRAEEEGWALGDRVQVTFAETGPHDFTIRAIYEEARPAGDITLTHAAFEANMSEQFDRAVFVAYEEGVDLEAARSELEELTAKVAPLGEVRDQREQREEIAGQINQLVSLIFALLFLAIFISLLGIANSLALSVYERTREIGLLRAVGMGRGQVRATVRWESVIIALIGTFLGLVISVAFAWAIVRALATEGFEVLSVPVGQIVAVVVVAALAGVLAGVLPARRAARLDVLEAISYE